MAVGINGKAEYPLDIANVCRLNVKDVRSCREEIALLDTKDPERNFMVFDTRIIVAVANLSVNNTIVPRQVKIFNLKNVFILS